LVGSKCIFAEQSFADKTSTTVKQGNMESEPEEVGSGGQPPVVRPNYPKFPNNSELVHEEKNAVVGLQV